MPRNATDRNGPNGNGRKHGHRGENPRTGPLIIIGGGEDKEKDRVILKEVARRVGGGKLVVTTVASRQPEGYFETYAEVFRELGLENVACLEIRTRCDALSDKCVHILDDAAGIFFTGGDQLKITSQIGDTPVERRIWQIHESGGLVAGTSAGASVMCQTMLVRGSGRESHRIGDIEMGPGLGLIEDVIIDQHFAERGRMGRPLGAVAENPRVLGIGIDEDTAIVVEGDCFHVLGSGGVYVVDGAGVTYSNVTEEYDTTLSLYDVRLHVLSQNDRFDLAARRPSEIPRQVALDAQVVEAEARG